MPTNRQRRRRPVRHTEVPEWARKLLETGEKPPLDTAEHTAFVEWLFFDEPVPGLPHPKTEEGAKLWRGKL